MIQLLLQLLIQHLHLRVVEQLLALSQLLITSLDRSLAGDAHGTLSLLFVDIGVSMVRKILLAQSGGGAVGNVPPLAGNAQD